MLLLLGRRRCCNSSSSSSCCCCCWVVVVVVIVVVVVVVVVISDRQHSYLLKILLNHKICFYMFQLLIIEPCTGRLTKFSISTVPNMGAMDIFQGVFEL